MFWYHFDRYNSFTSNSFLLNSFHLCSSYVVSFAKNETSVYSLSQGIKSNTWLPIEYAEHSPKDQVVLMNVNQSQLWVYVFISISLLNES